MNVKTVFMVYFMLTLFQLCGAHANTYSGTQAYNHNKLFTASVNTATGTFNFAYPLIKAPGLSAPFHLSVNYHFNNTGMYGLPTGWGLDLDYISDKTARLGGKQWLIDPLWHDETKFASGLKYYNQHGSYFEDAGVAKEIPGHKGLFYRYKATHKDGSLKYFSHQGLLVLEVDRFGSTVQFEYQKPVRDLTSARVTQITDNYGNRYRFSYEPNTLIVRYPDGREQKLYFNEKGVTDIINPLQQSYKISYLQQDSQNLIRSIEAPTGLITQLTYDSIPYKNGSATKHMPVVINFKQQDIATHETHHETHYKYAQGNNYTGYPLYALSSDGDSLMDSNDQGYRYSVEVNRSNADPTTPLMHQKIYSYNYLHLPAEILTQHQGRQYLKTTYEYAISPFKYSRSTNYDKPTVVTNLVWHADKNTYIPSDKITTAYDNYGNKTDERRFVYDPDKKQWIATQSKQQHYFTDNYSLPKETQHIDEISGKVLRTQYTLSPNGKTHARKTTAYRDGQGASGQGEPGQENTWHPWQQETLRYDGQGREILSTLEQLAKPPAEVQGVGIKSTHRQTHYHFNNSNGQLLTESISALGNIHSKVVDTRNGHQLKTITPLQETTAYTYDALGQQLTQTDPIGNVIRSSYAVYQTCGLNATTHQSPLGDQKRMIYDASHREIETQDQYNQQWRSLHKKAYNGWGKVIQTTDILGLTAHRDYDEQERLIRAEDPWGNEKTIHYNDSQMTTTTYHNGHKTTTKTQIPWQLITRTATYPVFENLYDIQENYLEKTLQHNGFGQVTEETSRLLQHQIKTPSDTLTSHYTYDASHNRTHSDTRGYDGSRYQRHTYYDLFNNKITHQKTVYTQAGSTTHLGYRYHYDEDNRLTQTETPLIDGHFSNSTQHHYDKNGRQIQTTLQNGHVVDYQYNPLGQLISSAWHRDDKPYRVSHSYDADGRLIQAASSDGQTLHYEYTSNGHLLKTSYPDGRSLAYQYDAYDRIRLQVDYNQLAQRYIYHKADKGQLSEVYYGDNKVSYHYGTDDNGRKGQLLARHTDFMNEGKTTTHHHYGPYGLPALSSTTNSMHHISYDVSYHYKPRGELITQTTQLKEDNNPATSTTIHYQYDAMNRLIDEQHEQQKQTRKHIHYRYDGNNNLLEKTHKTPTEQQHLTYRYNVLDQLVSIETDGKNNRTPIIHDTNGRLLQDSQGARYEYDDIDLLTRVTPMHGSVINYRYLPNGLLAERLSGSQHSDYYYDPQKRIITAFNDHHWRSFIREGRTITAAVGEQGIDQLYKANQSTGVVVTQGKAQESHYEGYGKHTDTDTDTNTATHIAKHTTKDTINDFGWNQELTDDAVHLTYLRNRFYNIDTQRFITRDHYPVDNRYAYAKGNPITNIDPTGHNAQQAMNYGLGGGFTALGIIGAIFAVPTGGASLTLSAAAGVGAGVTGALSGISLMGSQAALDSGNKAAAKALQYTSIVLGALSAVEGVVAIAPKVASFFGMESRYLTRYVGFLRNTREEVDMYRAYGQYHSEIMGSTSTDTVYSPWEISEQVEIAQSQESLTAAVNDWDSTWKVIRKAPAGYTKEHGISYYVPSQGALKTQAFGKPPYVPSNLLDMEFPPRKMVPTKVLARMGRQVDKVSDAMGGNKDLATQWYKKTRSFYEAMTPIQEE